jgi:hypothetical protein
MEVAMFRVSVWMTMGLMLFVALGCDNGEIRTVWIADVTPAVVPVGELIQVRGKGLSVLPEPVEDTDATTPPVETTPVEDEEPVGTVYTGPDAVLIGGVPAEVFARSDDRLDVRVPDVPPGPVFLVVWSNGIASNAATLTIVPTSAEDPSASSRP